MPIELLEGDKPAFVILAGKRMRYLRLHGKVLRDEQTGDAYTPEAAIAALEAKPSQVLQLRATAPARKVGRTVTLSVRSYLPSETSLTRGNLHDRFGVLEREFAGVEGAVDLFLVPEYFFNWRVGENGGAEAVAPSTEQQMKTLVVKLQALSTRHPETVFVPGTIVWEDGSGRLRNSAHVFRGGELLGTNPFRYDKNAIDYETSHVRVAKGKDAPRIVHDWQPGGQSYMDFTHKDVRCRLQICADIGVSAIYDEIDLQVVIAAGFGATRPPNTRVGGGIISVNLGGSSVYRQKLGSGEATEESQPTTSTRPITVEVPDQQGA